MGGSMLDTQANSTAIISDSGRIVVGFLGGLSAILVRYLSQDHQTVLSFIEAYNANAGVQWGGLYKILFSYVILTPILLVLGSIIGWLAEESSKIKLFALAVSAPALITTWANGPEKRMSDLFDSIPVSTAYAQSSDAPLYAVQVAAFAQPELAVQLVATINKTDPSVRAFITELKNSQGVTFSRVRVTQMLSLRDALALRERLLRQGITREANIVDVTSQ